jgi:hypothetical protein
VVDLERIVGVDLRVVEGGREQLIEDAWVDPYRSVVTSVGETRVRLIAWAKSLLAASCSAAARGRRR